MQFNEILGALRRRWYIAVAGLLLSAGLVAAAVLAVPASYTVTTSVLLIPPKSTVGPRGNPFMNLGGLSPALDVLTTRLLARPETQRLIKANPAAEVIVGADTSTAGPILLISVKAPDATEALQLRSDVSAEVLPTLKALQDELVVPDLSRISTMVLASNPEPARDGKNQLRIAIVAAAAGLGGTALMIALVDRMLSRRAAEPRRPRRHRRKGEPDLQPSDAWWADTDTDAAAVQPSGDRDDSWRGVDQGPSEKQSVGSGPARGST